MAKTADVLVLAKDRTDAAVNKMNDALRAKCDHVRELLAEARQGGARSRHRIGSVVLELKADAGKYGQNAVKLLARAVGRDEDSLYTYATVAEAWPGPDFRAVMQRKGVHGIPLSFSHLMVIAGVASRRDREALVEQALAHGLSTRALRGLLGNSKARDGSRPSATHSLPALVSFTSRALDRATTWEPILERLAKRPSSKELEQELAEAIDVQLRLGVALGRQTAVLNEQLARVRAELGGTGVPSGGERRTA